MKVRTLAPYLFLLSSVFAQSNYASDLIEVQPGNAPTDSDEVTLIQLGGVTDNGTPAGEETPSIWLAVKKTFSVDVITRFGTGYNAGNTSGEVKFSVDLGPLRDLLINSKILERDTTNFGTFAEDLALLAGIEAIGGVVEWGIRRMTGDDTYWSGTERFIREVQDHGIGAIRWDGVGWKDSNFGTWNNTIHGVPFFAASAFFRARGYSPVVSALAGIITQLVIHETIFECWEQPKSGHDFLMNSLSAIAGAIPGLGQEIQYSPFTHQMTSKFYVEDPELGRVFVGIEQIHGFKGLIPEQMPIRPWNLILGVEHPFSGAVSVGAEVIFVEDRDELHNFWKTFQIGMTELAVYMKLRLP